MHASATSRTSSVPVNPQASQANDANRADQDSPFALLMAASAPSEDKPALEQKEIEKPANDQASTQPAPAKPQARTESKTKAKPDEKTKPDEKSAAENDGQGKKEEVAASNDNPAPTTDVQAAQTDSASRILMPLVVIADPAIPAPASDTPVQEEPAAPIDTATSVPQPAAKPAQDLAAVTAAQANLQANAQAMAPAMQASAPENAAPATPVAAAPTMQSAPQTQQPAAPQAPQISTPETQAQQDGAPQLTPPQIAAAQTALPQTTAPQVAETQKAPAQQQPAQDTLVQLVALQNAAATKPVDATEPSDAAAHPTGDVSLTVGAAKPVAHDTPPDNTENKTVKPDTVKPEIASTDSAKPDISQPAPVEAAKPVPQTQTPGTNMAAPNTAASQPLQATAPSVPGIPQHVQVSAQAPAPNMPALAVEIAAKSQSGAKQFDIRLDPPELGRVEVRLSIDAAGKASAHLSADQPQTLDLLQKDASSLTRALREAGLNVSQDGLNFSLRQQSHDGGTAQQGQGQGRNPQRGMTLIATNSIDATPSSTSWRGDGRLDIRV